MHGKIVRVSGPLVVADGMREIRMYDMVNVGPKALIGEVIELRDDRASIQVYENTDGLHIGDKVESLSMPLFVELGPGLMSNVFDGIGRSLISIYEHSGDRISTGLDTIRLDHSKKWKFSPCVKTGAKVCEGDILGTVQETEVITHKILVPVGVSGVVDSISKGEFTIEETIARIKQDNGTIHDVTMLVRWPVRVARPHKGKLTLDAPLVTGQRIIDTLFPIALGGVAAVPGPFGSGKTVVQHQLAKWSEADLVVYIGCGERGNEMTDVLREFPELTDPRTGKGLLSRTILVANTSDMPVAAREASIYTGITIAEYYRDMGYNVVIMADSTSRWAEALREMSGRLEEMPGEEGYPAYLGSRLAGFYERAGKVSTLGSEERRGSITAVGAISPQGGDLSEPVSQATLRIVKVFWGLSASLANRRHFPAIDWLISYSGYSGKLSNWYKNNVSYDFTTYKAYIMRILQEESELNEVVQLVGFDVLSDKDKITLDIAQVIREDYLQQNAFDEVDTYASITKQEKMLKIVYTYANLAQNAVAKGLTYDKIVSIGSRGRIARMKYVAEFSLDELDSLLSSIQADFTILENKEGV